MWKFGGEVQYACQHCNYNDSVPIEDFNSECIGGSERGMGDEHIHEISYEFDCAGCNTSISLIFEISEYPLNCLNFTLNKSIGAETIGEPSIIHLQDIYNAEDLLLFYNSIKELMNTLKTSPKLLHKITPREFEEVVTEIFRAKGFQVDLTQRTADGGKDIIAIHTDALGIRNKYFIECKRYSKDNKVGVALVRALQGVKNTKDGPNKTILVTTSTFTSGAKKFVEHEASSKWDITLAGYEVLVKWLGDYE